MISNVNICLDCFFPCDWIDGLERAIRIKGRESMTKRLAVYGSYVAKKPVFQRYWKRRVDGIKQRYWKKLPDTKKL